MNVFMKKKIDYLSLLLFIIIIPLFTMSCSDKPEIIKETPVPPSITSLSPESGTGGTEVTIVGENFPENSNDVKVAFGSTNAKITSFSKNKIKVNAPSGFSDSKVNVTISSGGKVSNIKEFYFTNTTPPSITSLSPDSGTAETEVTIAGDNFGDNSSDVKVAFGSKDATISSFSKKKLR